MKRKNVKEKDIEGVFIAGTFGNYINPENARAGHLRKKVLKKCYNNI